MAPRVNLHWCVLACAARSAAEPPPPADQGGFATERSLADPASFVVVQGLWLPPETAEADAAPQSTDALPVEGFHGVNAGHGLGWLRSEREFIRVLGREERVSVIAEESSPRGAYDNRTYVLHRCGGCRWMPPLECLLNASRAANGVSEQATAEALAAVWETRVLATFKQ